VVRVLGDPETRSYAIRSGLSLVRITPRTVHALTATEDWLELRGVRHEERRAQIRALRRLLE